MLMHQLLIDGAWRHPDDIALRCVDRAKVLSYGEAVTEMDKMAGALTSLGVEKGDRVSVFAHNGMDYLIAMLGTWRLGAISALVNVKFADDLPYYFADHTPAVVIYTHDMIEPVKRAVASVPSIRHLVCMDGPQDGALSLPELMAANLPAPADPWDETAIAHLSYTSGTTGKPKGACLAHEPTVRAARCIAERLQIVRNDVSFGPTALSSSYQLVANLLPPLAKGASVNVMGRWSQASGWDAMDALGATAFVANPTLLEEVLTESRLRGKSPGTLRYGLSGGGPVPDALIETPVMAIAGARDLIRRTNRPGGRVQAGIAPCMIWTVDEAVLRLTRKLADETALVTTHIAETTFELLESDRRYGQTDTEFLSDIGFLGPDVLAVHCVHCKSHDIHLLRRHGVKVSHNPCSNLYLASGIPPIPEMHLAGVTVGLGSDGSASSNNHSLFQAMKFAALIQKGLHQDATIMTAEKVIEMATIDGAHAVGLGHEIGSVEVGKKADLIVIDCDNPFMAPIHNPVSAIVYSALGNEVSNVVIDGSFVMRDGVVMTVDERAVRQKAQMHADALAIRAGSDRFKNRGWRSPAI